MITEKIFIPTKEQKDLINEKCVILFEAYLNIAFKEDRDIRDAIMDTFIITILAKRNIQEGMVIKHKLQWMEEVLKEHGHV